MRKWISYNITPKLTARYIHSVYEATHYTHFPQPHILYSSFILHVSFRYVGDRGSAVDKVLCYKSEGHWFDPSWCHGNFSLT